jgi:hypothetical protein
MGRNLNSDNDVALMNTTVQGGPVDLVGASVRGSLLLSFSRLVNHGRRVVNGERMQLTGALVADRLHTVGEIHLHSAVIAGQLDCREAHLTNPAGSVLVADNTRIANDVLCSGGFVAEGTIRLAGAAVDGRLDFSGARLANVEGPALVLDSARIANGILMAEGFAAEGEVRLAGTTVNGLVDCGGATFANAAGVPELGHWP